MLSLPRRVRLALVCCGVGAVASASGGIFTFPILSPTLVVHLKLTQPQLTTVVLAGVVGQYPFAVFVGKVVDRHGPWICALTSACLFSSGFGLFARELAKTNDDISLPSQSSFHTLAICYFLAGLGTAFGLFSSLFAAAKAFPTYMGLASGASMAMFGLSPLLLSYIASGFFSDDKGLDVTSFVAFMAVFAGVINSLAAVLFRLPVDDAPGHEASESISQSQAVPGVASPSSSSTEPDERDALLPKGPHVDVEVVEVMATEPDGSLWDLFKDPYYWLLFFIAFAILGSCEMIIANIGSIALSLPSARTAGAIIAYDRETDVATATQVRLIALANTIARLLSGPLADFISPIASYLPNGVRSYPRKHWISRMAFVAGAGILCILGFVALEFTIRSQASLWLLSICTGLAYGTLFSILPSILSAAWGANNVGRNFGVITYAPFVGTPVFSYLYAFVAERHADHGICTGVECWSLTIWIAVGSVAVACLANAVLWKRWKGNC